MFVCTCLYRRLKSESEGVAIGPPPPHAGHTSTPQSASHITCGEREGRGGEGGEREGGGEGGGGERGRGGGERGQGGGGRRKAEGRLNKLLS